MGHLRQELQQEKERSARLQKRLDQSTADLEQVKPTTALQNSVQCPVQHSQPLRGTGAGEQEREHGVVARGKLNGQAVAIKWPQGCGSAGAVPKHGRSNAL